MQKNVCVENKVPNMYHRISTCYFVFQSQGFIYAMY